MKKFYQLLITQLKASTRNRALLFFTLIFPLIFMGVFGIAFQQSDPATTTIPIAIINNDLGIPDNLNLAMIGDNPDSKYQFSELFITLLSEVTFEDNTTKIFEIQNANSKAHEIEKVQRQTIKGLIIIPEDFTMGYFASLRTAVNNETLDWTGFPSSNYTTQVGVIGDTSLVQFNIVSSVVGALVDHYFSLNNPSSNGQMIIESTVDSKGFTTFDFVVPGLVIFAIISNANTVAAVALIDVESKLLERLKLTKVKIWQYPAALVTSQIIISFIQIPLLFGTALMFGFPFTPQLVGAFMFAFFVSIAMSGLGLLMAGFFKSGETAGSLAAIITTPMAFFAGAFFQMPNPEIIPGGIIGDPPVGIFDLLPPTRSINALRLIIFNDYTLYQILPDLVITMFLAVFYLLLGIIVYGRKHLRLFLN